MLKVAKGIHDISGIGMIAQNHPLGGGGNYTLYKIILIYEKRGKALDEIY